MVVFLFGKKMLINKKLTWINIGLTVHNLATRYNYKCRGGKLMKKRRRTEILVKGSMEIAKKLAKEIMDNYPIKTIEEPNNGLVMVKMRETAKKNLFYLGEIFVTEAKVQVEDSIGIGIVYGNNQELAFCLAVIDAAYNGSLKETESWSEILLNEEKNIKIEANKYQAKILKTKVSFETMDI